MKSTWILVADSSRARIFVADTPSTIQEIEDFTHTEGRLHEQDMTSDLPGKAAGVAGAGKHAYQDQIGPKEQEAINFAKSIAKHFDEAHSANKFDRLMIISDPSFLGKLRKHLSDQSQKAICFELDKNITTHSVDDIRKHLPKHLTRVL
ncbi:MAG: host attachment protein [Methylococcales bacterium]|nr:host attachment protein [Methylococcales bacterium]